MQKKLLFVLCWVFFIVSFLWFLRGLLLGLYPDFQTQYYVPKLVLSGINPYVENSNLHTPQVYPPTAFFFFLPFSVIDYTYAPFVYLVVSIMCLLASFLLLFKIFKISFFSTDALLLSSLSFISFPTKFTLGMGQVNFIILFLLVLSLHFINSNRKFISGIFIGVSLGLKIMPIFLVIYFLLKLEKKILLGVISTTLILFFLVLGFLPKVTYLGFIEILPSLISSWKLDYYNQALSGFIGRSFGTGDFSSFLKIILSSILIGVTFFIVLKNKRKDIEKLCLIFGTLITLNLIVNTLSWQHHFVRLIIPFFATYFAIKKLKNKKVYLLNLVISYILVSINIKDPNVLPIILKSHVLFGSLLLLFIQLKFLSSDKIGQRV